MYTKSTINQDDQQTLKIGEILLKRKLVTQFQLEQVLKIQSLKSRLTGEILVEFDIIKPDHLEMALKEQYWRQNGYWIID